MPSLSSQQISAALARPLSNELELLRAISELTIRDAALSALFAELHLAALRDGRKDQLLGAYERLLGEALAPAQLGELALQVAWFAEEQLQDRELAMRCAVRSLDFVPDSQAALSFAEALLIEADDFATLGRLYLRAVQHSPDPNVRRRLLKHALSTLSEVPEAQLIVVALQDALVREAPEEQTELFERLDAYYRDAGLDAELAELVAVMSDAFARLERRSDELSMLTRELKLASGERLATVQRRLAGLRLELLEDNAGALELLEPLLLANPADAVARALCLRAGGTPPAQAASVPAASAPAASAPATPVPPPAAAAEAPAPQPFARAASAPSLEAEPAARVRAYLSMLEHTADAEERAGLLFALGSLARDELEDLNAAVDYWRSAAEASPTHLGVHEALLGGYSALGDARSLDDEIARGLSTFGDPLREKTLVRFVDALLGRGRGKEILPLCITLLERDELEDPVLDALERVAMQADDTDALRTVLERRVAAAKGAAQRAQALERLGEFFDERMGDKAAASQAWKAAAAEYQHRSNEGPESQRLYERALDAEPNDAEAATHLVELYADAGEWTHVADACAALLRGAHEPKTLELLLSLEGKAERAGGAHEFAALVDEALASWGEDIGPFARRLQHAKARALSHAERDDEAADVYQELLTAEAEPALLSELEALIAASPSAEWRYHRQRWLFAWRVARSSEPLAVELEWAAVEENTFNDASAAIGVLESAVLRDAGCVPAWQSLSRLKLTTGDIEGGLAALGKLREQVGPQASAAFEMQMAALLVDRLEQPSEALSLVEGTLAAEPAHPEARRLIEKIAAGGSAQAFQACELLEQASHKADPPEQQRAVLAMLLEQNLGGSGDKKTAARRKTLRKRWFKALLDLADDRTALALSERAAAEFMAEPMLWEATEGVAVRLGDPGLAVTAYERALSRELPAEIAELLGQRVRAFAAEHVEDPRRIEPALMRVLLLAPSARWALDQVKFNLSATRRFEELFTLYDHALGAAEEPESRQALLDEAAIAARDVAEDPDRAIGYFRQHLELKPDDRRVDAALERLYERRGYTDKLIVHLERRAARVEQEERTQLRERIATLHVDRNDAPAALGALRSLLAEAPENAVAYELLERLLIQPSQSGEDDGWEDPPDQVPAVAALLKAHYRAQKQPVEVARVAQLELGRTIEVEPRVALLEELAELEEQELASPAGAFKVLADLLRLRANSEPYRRRLGALAEKLGCQRELLELLLEVANSVGETRLRSSLLLSAVALCGPLGDRARAVEIHARLLDESHDAAQELASARALDGLLAELGRNAERCTVLERLATLESEPELRRRALDGAASLALGELGVPERAAAAYRGILQADPADRAAHDGLVRALDAARHYRDLCAALVARAELCHGSPEERADLERAARLYAEPIGDHEQAIELWQRVREQFGPSPESLDALTRLLSSVSRFVDLAALLDAEAAVATDPIPLYAQLAEVHHKHTGDLPLAVSAYVHAKDFGAAAQLLLSSAELLTDDALLSAELARGLRESGRLAEAEQLLRGQLAHYGVRHPKPRKRVHLELAELLAAQGNAELAMVELTGASQHDPSDPELLLAIARLAKQRGERERAEQSYRSLLLVLHGGQSDAALTRSEIYLELAALSTDKGELDAARDLEASAFDAAESSETETAGLEATLRRLGRHDLLERVLKTRLEQAKSPADTSLALANFTRHHASRGTLTDELKGSALKTAERLTRELTRSKKSLEVEPLRRLAAVYEDLAEPERALAVLDALVAKASTPAERRAGELDIARRLLEIPARRGDGVTRLRKLVIAEEEPPVAWLELLAEALEADGQLAEAIRVLRRVPAAAESLQTLRAIVRLSGASGESSGEPADLARLFALESGVEAVAIGLRLAATLRSQADVAALEPVLEQLLALDPSQSELQNELLASYEAREDWAAVARVLTQALQALPSDRGLRARLGAVRYRLLAAAGRYDEALDELERASDLDSSLKREFTSALEQHALATSSERWALRLADAHAARAEHEPAIAIYRRLLGSASAETRSRIALALCKACAAVGRASDAIADLERALANGDTGLEVRRALAELYQQSGQGAKAATLLIASAEAEREPAAQVAGLLTAARLLHEAQARDAALAALGKLRAIEPAHIEGLELTAQVLVEQGESTQALALLEAFASAPERARLRTMAGIHRRIADIHLHRDDLVEAKEALQQAHHLDKADLDTLFTLGIVASDIDDLELATTSLRAVVAVKERQDSAHFGPEQLSEAYFNLARIENRRGLRTSARRMAARAVQENPRHGEAERLLRHLSA